MKNLSLIILISLVLVACTEVDNKDFYQEYVRSDYYSCPNTNEFLVVCRIQYSTDSINFYDLTDGQVFPYGFGNIQNIKIIFNVSYVIDYSNSGSTVLIENGQNISLNGPNSLSASSGSDYIIYQVTNTSRGNFVISIPDSKTPNTANSILTIKNGAIKESKSISFSIQ